MLMDDHNTKQMASALMFLMCYAQEGDEFLDSIVAGDETRRTISLGKSLTTMMRCKRKS
jgi:hypothetical protein